MPGRFLSLCFAEPKAGRINTVGLSALGSGTRLPLLPPPIPPPPAPPPPPPPANWKAIRHCGVATRPADWNPCRCVLSVRPPGLVTRRMYACVCSLDQTPRVNTLQYSGWMRTAAAKECVLSLSASVCLSFSLSLFARTSC